MVNNETKSSNEAHVMLVSTICLQLCLVICVLLRQVFFKSTTWEIFVHLGICGTILKLLFSGVHLLINRSILF